MVRRKRSERDEAEGGAIASARYHVGGALRPLSRADLSAIVAHAFDVLTTVGMAGLPPAATPFCTKVIRSDRGRAAQSIWAAFPRATAVRASSSKRVGRSA